MGVSIIFFIIACVSGEGFKFAGLKPYYGGSMPLNLFMYFPRDFVTISGLAITAKQAKKKWNNLKDKYKVPIIYLRLKCEGFCWIILFFFKNYLILISQVIN